jgi:flagellar biosynthesis repressor protein FlbT
VFHDEGRGAGSRGESQMALKLSLKPGEKFVVNGAVIENGDRRATLLLQNKASILREKDIMQPDECNSPAKRVYFPIMMMYLENASTNALYDEFVTRLSELMAVLESADMLKECVAISREVMTGEYYKALGRCRKLISYEEERIGNVGTSLPTGRS